LIPVGNAPASLAVSADAVWVVNTLDDTASRISPESDSVVNTVPVGDGPSRIAIVNGIVWVANESDGTLSRIDPGLTPGQPFIRKMEIGSVPQGLAGVNGDLWVSVRGSTTSHRGGTLRLVSDGRPESLDQGFYGEGVYASRVLHLLGDGLVAFEPVGGTNSTLVPDLATSVPVPTDGGRTYTFELRSGIRYSNGEIVAPGDFRRALQRGFRIEAGLHAYFYGGLRGGEACRSEPRTCDLSRGIVTDDVTGAITFHLVEPDPEFPYKLTLPFAYPVPPSTPDEHQPTEGVPGTGPYMLEAPMTSEGLVLVRNPYFRVRSPAQPDGYVDQIEWTFGVGTRGQLEAVAAGDADVAIDIDSNSYEEIFVRFAAQVHTSPSAETIFFVLNNEAPPFDEVEVRRAMNLALDRGRLLQILGGEGIGLPTCQTLPPNFPGYEPYCPYTMDPGPEGQWTAPDLEEAQRIIRRSGTRGMRVVFEMPRANHRTGARTAGYVIELLDELGYRGSARFISLEEFYDQGDEFQMAHFGWSADYPAASNFLSLYRCDATVGHPPGFCDPRIDALIDHAIRVQADDPAASGPLWAEIDREIVDQAPVVWSVNLHAIEFVSERVGNYQRHLQWGPLLNQIWVR
jgi:ABC-type transport system substrate-binding protein